MKKIFLFAALLISQIATIQAFDVEARIAYYLPIDHRITSIYGHHGYPEYEVEANCPINTLASFCGCSCDKDWSSWANFSIFHKKGHAKNNCTFDSDDSGSCSGSNRTEFTNWTLNFGIKRYLGACCFPESFRPYLGLGIGYANAHFKDHSEYVKKNRNFSGFALLAKSGIEFDIACNIYLNAFADYASNWFDRSKSKCCNSTRRFNSGGLKLGLGIGYHF